MRPCEIEKFPMHLLMDGVDLLMVQELLGHKDIKTTKIYLGRPGKRIQNAIENLNSKASFLSTI
jgi:site-specific recombinase XerD